MDHPDLARAELGRAAKPAHEARGLDHGHGSGGKRGRRDDIKIEFRSSSELEPYGLGLSMGGQGSIARTPIVTIFPTACCAAAASGHAAAPPSNVMNSRRLMGFTPRPEIME